MNRNKPSSQFANRDDTEKQGFQPLRGDPGRKRFARPLPDEFGGDGFATKSPLFELNCSARRRITGKDRVDFFVRKPSAHVCARVDEVLTCCS